MREEELLDGWLPYRIVTGENGEVKFRWFYAGDKCFTEPFFEETISTCLSLPENGKGSFPVTGAETLLNVAQRVQSVQPTGFIYHISRCGSTLLTQMLSCDPECIVLSEVPLLDSLLRLPLKSGVPGTVSVKKLFAAVLTLLGQKKNKNQRCLFVKTDSWHVLFHDQLAEWYPDAHSFLLFRSPREVAASHALTPAMHAVPGLLEPELFGLNADDTVHMRREEYLEHVLCTYLRKYESILRGHVPATALNYHSGVWQMMEQLFAACSYRPGADVLAVMKQRTTFHSKQPGNIFTGDGDRMLQHDFRDSEKLFCAIQEIGNEVKPIV